MRGPALDAGRVLRLALIHDLGEIYAGDLIPADGVLPAEKQAREREAVRRVLGRLPNGDLYEALWEEYEAGATPEARFVRQIDRLEMGLQAEVYARQGLVDAAEFIASARQALDAPVLQEALRAAAG